MEVIIDVLLSFNVGYALDDERQRFVFPALRSCGSLSFAHAIQTEDVPQRHMGFQLTMNGLFVPCTLLSHSSVDLCRVHDRPAQALWRQARVQQLCHGAR